MTGNEKITLTSEQARMHAKNLSDISVDIRNVNLTLNTMKESTLAPWKGNAKNEFVTAFEDVYPKLQDAVAILSEISNKLYATADAADQLDGIK